MAVTYFVLSLLAAWSTFCALVAPRRPVALGMLSFMFGLIPSELPFAVLAAHLVATVVFVSLGVLGSAFGMVGLGLSVVSAAGLAVLARRSAQAGPVIERALTDGLGASYPLAVPPELATRVRTHVPLGPVLLKPFSPRRRDVERLGDIAYSDGGVRNLLDVYRHRSRPNGCPTLVHIHGGAWTIGKKTWGGMPLMYHLASQGWVCVAPNYRLSPAATFPDHLVDIKKVLAWVRMHGPEYGADPGLVLVAGGSAGGHLAALAALTPNEPAYQPGFEDADTSVAAAIPLYGDYDWLDRHGVRAGLGLDRLQFFIDKIMKSSPIESREEWEKASPLSHIREDAPPFFVLHGDRDSLLMVEDTRHFVNALRAVSAQPVVYAELPGAQHGFDSFTSVRSGHVINGIEWFTAWVRSTRTAPIAETRPPEETKEAT